MTSVRTVIAVMDRIMMERRGTQRADEASGTENQ
jgi:hypothetical protein